MSPSVLARRRHVQTGSEPRFGIPSHCAKSLRTSTGTWLVLALTWERPGAGPSAGPPLLDIQPGEPAGLFAILHRFREDARLRLADRVTVPSLLLRRFPQGLQLGPSLLRLRRIDQEDLSEITTLPVEHDDPLRLSLRLTDQQLPRRC